MHDYLEKVYYICLNISSPLSCLTLQSIERAHSVQSTASSVYEAMSLKQERERPQSSHSNRDDDRNSLKDLSISRRY